MTDPAYGDTYGPGAEAARATAQRVEQLLHDIATLRAELREVREDLARTRTAYVTAREELCRRSRQESTLALATATTVAQTTAPPSSSAPTKGSQR